MQPCMLPYVHQLVRPLKSILFLVYMRSVQTSHDLAVSDIVATVIYNRHPGEHTSVDSETTISQMLSA